MGTSSEVSDGYWIKRNCGAGSGIRAAVKSLDTDLDIPLIKSQYYVQEENVQQFLDSLYKVGFTD